MPERLMRMPSQYDARKFDAPGAAQLGTSIVQEQAVPGEHTGELLQPTPWWYSVQIEVFHV
jgi:hypothetical protein